MDRIAATLKTYYDIDAAVIMPQQGGWAALAYRVSDASRSYFLKLYEKSRASTPKWTAKIDVYVPILMWLAQHSGLKGKLPVPYVTKNGRYRCEDEEGIYMLYEYIESETIGERPLTGEQVRLFADIVAELHAYGENIPAATDAVIEDFAVPFLQPLRQTLEKGEGGLPRDLGELLAAHAAALRELIGTVDRLAAVLKTGGRRKVLCHMDLHHWNLMQSGSRLMLIDWEGLRLAPPEADLMFIAEQPYFDEFMSIYRQRHSDYAIDLDALRFYQGRRRLEDIWEFMEQLLFDNQKPEEKAKTLASLKKELEEMA